MIPATMLLIHPVECERPRRDRFHDRWRGQVLDPERTEDMNMVRFRPWLTAASLIAAAGSGLATSRPTVLATSRAQSAIKSAVREAYAGLPGVRIWYADSGGSGQPVVFMHAATGSSQVWGHQIPAFTEAGYRFIAYDRRGWGRSVIDPAGLQPGTVADDLLALMDHLGVDRFHLVATAAGGFGALDFSLSFPQRLRSLVVANSIGGGP